MRYNFFCLNLILIISSLILSGCAAFFTASPNATITVTSTPANALVYVDSKFVSTTPFTTILETNIPHQIKIMAEGYNPEEIMLYNASNYVAFLDGLWGLPVLIVNFANHAQYKLDKKNIDVMMTKKENKPLRDFKD